MEQNFVRKIISDKVWQVLEPAIAKAKHSSAGARGERSEREFIEAVLYLNRAGCPWRDLPPALGYWHAIYMRFRRWEARGVWQRLWQTLQGKAMAEARTLFLDSTTVRAHPHAAGAPKKTAPIRLWDALVEVGAPKSTRRPSTKTAVSRSI
jgi:transposase